MWYIMQMQSKCAIKLHLGEKKSLKTTKFILMLPADSLISFWFENYCTIISGNSSSDLFTQTKPIIAHKFLMCLVFSCMFL